MQVLLALLQPSSKARLQAAQDTLVQYCLAAGIMDRIAAAFALFDRPQVRGECVHACEGVGDGARQWMLVHSRRQCMPLERSQNFWFLEDLVKA